MPLGRGSSLPAFVLLVTVDRSMVTLPTPPTSVGVVLFVGIDLLLVDAFQGVEEATPLGALSLLHLQSGFTSRARQSRLLGLLLGCCWARTAPTRGLSSTLTFLFLSVNLPRFRSLAGFLQRLPPLDLQPYLVGDLQEAFVISKFP